ncbi:MAG TPA: NAD(P)/FAD-dependent oxidoreductase [Thermodesulfovibrionales bacterium]|nr:NAD(P)/FAD-dependent oxidoreductase [Thermodesulfovibrionales bacterium]
MRQDVIVIGAGASGLVCALSAARRRRSVLILEHNKKIGAKIRISGGGRCNFTNVRTDADNYLSWNPDFPKSALARFTSYDFIAMLERHGIRYYEEEEGRLFCAKGSEEIIRMLQRECDDAGVGIRLHCRVIDIKRKDEFVVTTDQGQFTSKSLVIATGGLSYPRVGATDLGYRIARKFGLRIRPLKPALVPFTFEKGAMRAFQDLSGTSLDASVGCNGAHFRGKILFTHRGLSGPAILQISSYWNPGDALSIDLYPGGDVAALLVRGRQSKMEMHNLLAGFLPKNFSRMWCEAYSRSKPVNQYTDRELKAVAALIHNWTVEPSGTEGYGKAEVTLGGIETDELSSKTMEARNVPGLYFIGEVIDVTGQLGGYNLQWAWASGHAAGRYV